MSTSTLASERIDPLGSAASGISGSVRRLTPLWGWVRGFLIAYLIACIVYMLAMLTQIGVYQLISTGGLASDQILAATTASDLFVFGGSIALTATLIACAFLWLRFTYRAMRNLHIVGARNVTIGPVWAVGWYFVPIASLWKPLEAVLQIWRGSANPSGGDGPNVPATVGWWWGLWLLSGVAEYISLQASTSVVIAPTAPGEVRALLMSNTIEVATISIDIVIVFLALDFLGKIARMQDSQWQAEAFA